ALLDRAPRPPRRAGRAPCRAGRGGARPRRRRPRADVLGGDEAAPVARARRRAAAARAPARRALRRPRPARRQVAGELAPRLQGRRRRRPAQHARLRRRLRRPRPRGDPRRRPRGPRHADGDAGAGRRPAALRPARGGAGLTYARRAWTVRWKETLNALLFFALLLLFVFQFTLGADRERLTAALPGLLWLGFVLSGLLG